METLILLSVKELAVAATIGQLNSYNRMKAKRVKVENPPHPCQIERKVPPTVWMGLPTPIKAVRTIL